MYIDTLTLISRNVHAQLYTHAHAYCEAQRRNIRNVSQTVIQREALCCAAFGRDGCNSAMK